MMFIVLFLAGTILISLGVLAVHTTWGRDDGHALLIGVTLLGLGLILWGNSFFDPALNPFLFHAPIGVNQ